MANLITIAVIRPFEVPPKGADLVVFSDIRNYVAQWDTQNLLRSSQQYAREHQVYLVPNRFIAGEYLSLCIIGPDGEIIGGQRATHLNLTYRGSIARSDDFNIFETYFGKVFLAVDVDLYRPELMRAAALSGCSLIIGSQFIQPADYHPMRGLYGAYNMARTNGVYVLDANNMVTNLAAPCPLPGCPTGFLLRDCDDLPAVARIDLDLAVGADPHRHLDESFYRRYSPQLGGAVLR